MSLLAATLLASVITVLSGGFALPEALRIPLGVLMVLLLPGFALICVLLPDAQLSRSELWLASLGSSLAVSTCACVLLGATPVGLSRESLALVLGGGSMALSVLAGARELRFAHARQSRSTDRPSGAS